MIVDGIGPGFVYGVGVAGALAAFLAITGVGLALALAIIGYGFVAGFYAGFMNGLCDHWHNRRLACLDHDHDPRCAIGKVAKGLSPEDTGGVTKEPFFPNFDIDTTFNLSLMPHPPGLQSSESDESIKPIKPSKNFLFEDDFQGQFFLARRLPDPWDWSSDPKEQEGRRYLLHCEFETDLWKKICDVAQVLAPIAGALIPALTPVMDAACHAIASFLGPLGTLLHAVCWLLAPLLALALMVFLTIFIGGALANRGNPNASNVGESDPVPIKEGEPLVVSGDFVYDAGHCVGWHELHPVLRWRRVLPEEYLEHDPSITNTKLVPKLHPSVSANLAAIFGPTRKLTIEDVRNGLDSSFFASAAKLTKERWCEMLNQGSNPGVQLKQLDHSERWAVHPSIDGCAPDSGGLH